MRISVQGWDLGVHPCPIKRKTQRSPNVDTRIQGHQRVNTGWTSENQYSNVEKTYCKTVEEQTTMRRAIGNYCKWSKLFTWWHPHPKCERIQIPMWNLCVATAMARVLLLLLENIDVEKQRKRRVSGEMRFQWNDSSAQIKEEGISSS